MLLGVFLLEINLYNCITNPMVLNTINIDRWLEQIETGGAWRDNILRAREVGKQNKEYDKIKKQVPAVTYNFLFNKYKEDKNIISSTGFIYFDIDHSDFAINLIDAKKVFCYYKSFGGLGLAVIVKATNVTTDNFDIRYNEVATELGISEYIDSNAVKKSQFAVLSYDPDIYYNPTSYTFTKKEVATNGVQVGKEKNTLGVECRPTCTPNVVFEKLPHYYSNNRHLFATGDNIFTSKEFVKYEELFLPATIKVKMRKKTLQAYCSLFVKLNPTWTEKQVFAHIMHRNIKRCEIPHNNNVIASLVKSVFKDKEKGTLYTKHSKNRKIIFGAKTGLTPSEKIIHSNKVMGAWKREKTIAKIKEALKTTNDNKKISEITKISVRTIQRYLKIIK